MNILTRLVREKPTFTDPREALADKDLYETYQSQLALYEAERPLDE